MTTRDRTRKSTSLVPEIDKLGVIHQFLLRGKIIRSIMDYRVICSVICYRKKIFTKRYVGLQVYVSYVLNVIDGVEIIFKTLDLFFHLVVFTLCGL